MTRNASLPANACGVIETSEATGIIDLGDAVSPIQVFGTEAIRDSLGHGCVQQAIAARLAPGVSRLILNPDAHFGYGVPVGSVLISPTHLYPGPVGVDIKCSMSLLQMDVPGEAIQSHEVRRALIREIESRLAHGRHGAAGRSINEEVGSLAACQGASKEVLERLAIPSHWVHRCEDRCHHAADGSVDTLTLRLQRLLRERVVLDFARKSKQLGSYGGGNHFGECAVVELASSSQSGTEAGKATEPSTCEPTSIARHFGLRDGCVAFLSHCGSRGLGHALAVNQYRTLQKQFRKRREAFPSGDPELVYAEYGTREAADYLSDMALGGNFATVNHLLINAIVLEAFQKVLPGTQGDLVYFISHNMIRREWIGEERYWVHRKGATRAFPAGHAELRGTPFEQTGHPILLPGNARDGSSIMVAKPGAVESAFSVNHGAGRRLTRTAAKAQLRARVVRQGLLDADVLSNRREYPVDEAPDAYKDFAEVLRSVTLAGLAIEVAKLSPRFVIKEED